MTLSTGFENEQFRWNNENIHSTPYLDELIKEGVEITQVITEFSLLTSLCIGGQTSPSCFQNDSKKLFHHDPE